MLKIRLRRVGLRNRPAYRVVVIDSRKARDGEYLESVGHYDPRTKLLELKTERIGHWVSKGAQTSDTVGRLLSRYTRLQVPAAEALDSGESAAVAAEAVDSVESVAVVPELIDESVATAPEWTEPVSTPENATPTDTPKE